MRESALRARLLKPFGAFARAASEEIALVDAHLDPETIAAHAVGDLSADAAMEATRHLAVCTDGRCHALLREALSGLTLAQASLFGPRREETTESGASSIEKQTARTFECRDGLWEAFSELAEEEGASIDWLINDAMKAFAKERAAARSVRPPVVMISQTPPPPSVSYGGFQAYSERNTPTLQRAIVPVKERPSRPKFDDGARTLPPVALNASLTILFDGARYRVDRDRFVIGRGAPDLSIEDPDVSRHHVAIERAEGTYFLVDLGSKNGVTFDGERVSRRRITDGDRFFVCEHELFMILG